eukprot:TRINITY_DN5634_c0_g1_i1.p1 TRINITY_DN5634_c0_g1~~TRINITY_DN5634_c0_g1_i1.p1  ORF type:complete len:694 (+),score=156.51 TRINITY_DN5634_c0_g1_i1:83-2164(+)
MAMAQQPVVIQPPAARLVLPSAATVAAVQAAAQHATTPVGVQVNKKADWCWNFTKGTCILGQLCGYAHTEEELEAAKQSAAAARPVPRFKTDLCRHFSQKGMCPVGDSCRFAHGEEELQTNLANAAAAAAKVAVRKKKTELCTQFTMEGKCKFGGNCDFAHGEAQLEKKPEKSGDTCTFGRNCKRRDCWHDHPEGRLIDENPSLVMCRFGLACSRPDCFYLHPGDEGKVEFTIYLDELPMPKRPDVKPSHLDREVYIDPLPSDTGTDELENFLFSFGEVDEIFNLPGNSKAYVRFKEHEGAAACVAAYVGQWSESERAKAPAVRERYRDRRKRGGEDVINCYPEPLMPLLYTNGGADLKIMQDKTGVKNLRLHGGGAKPERVHFAAKGNEEQQATLRASLERLLAEAHERFAELVGGQRPCNLRVWGVPGDWSPEEAELFFGNYGDVARVRMRVDGSVEVAFIDPEDAPKVAEKLEGSTTGAEGAAELHCELLEPPVPEPPPLPPNEQYRDRVKRNRGNYGKSAPPAGAMHGRMMPEPPLTPPPLGVLQAWDAPAVGWAAPMAPPPGAWGFMPMPPPPGRAAPSGMPRPSQARPSRAPSLDVGMPPVPQLGAKRPLPRPKRRGSVQNEDADASDSAAGRPDGSVGGPEDDLEDEDGAQEDNGERRKRRRRPRGMGGRRGGGGAAAPAPSAAAE